MTGGPGWWAGRSPVPRGGRRSAGAAMLVLVAAAAASVLARELVLDTTVGAVYDWLVGAPAGLRAAALAALLAGVAITVRPRLRRHRRPQPDVAEPAGSSLPPAPTSFVGRERDLEAVLELLAPGPGTEHEPRLVGVVGHRGVGTSALAVHACHRIADQFPDGVIYLDLRGLATDSALSGESALHLVMHQVGLAEPRSRRPPDLEDAAVRLRDWLGQRRVLLLLNNVDQPEQVRRLLPAGPGCAAVLAGSVDLERLPGVRLRRLAELPEADAVRLLAAVSGPGRVDRSPRDAAALVNECGRQPLAIRLLGQLLRDRGWQLPHVVDVMQQVARASPYAPEPGELGSFRQVWDACDVTYRDLTTEQRRLFRLLALVPTIEIGRNAAAAVAGLPPERTTRLLEELARRGLVESARPGYYRVRQLLAGSARSHLEHEDSRWRLDRARRRLVRYYALLTEQYAEPLLLVRRRAGGGLPAGITDTEGYRWFRREHETLRRLVTSPAVVPLARSGAGDRHLAALKPWLWRLAVGLCTWYAAEGRLDAWQEVCRAVLAMPTPRGWWVRLSFVARRASPTAVAFWAHNELGVVHRLRGETGPAYHELDIAVRLARGRRHRGLAQVQTNLGLVLIDQGQLELAVRELERGLALRSRSDHRGRAISALGLGTAHLHAGDLEAARRHLSRAANEFELLGDERGMAASLNAVGLVLVEQDDRIGTEEHWDLARRLYTEAGDDLGRASVLLNLGAELLRSRPEQAARARDLLTESVLLRVGHPETRHTALAYARLADASQRCGELDAAQLYRQEAARILDDLSRS